MILLKLKTAKSLLLSPTTQMIMPLKHRYVGYKTLCLVIIFQLDQAHTNEENNKSKDAKTEQVVENLEHLNKMIQCYPHHLILQMGETLTNVEILYTAI